MGAKFHSQEGNSPDHHLRSLNLTKAHKFILCARLTEHKISFCALVELSVIRKCPGPDRQKVSLEVAIF